MILDMIKNKELFVIFGAQVVAYGAYTAIRKLTGQVPVCFAVGRLEGNPKEIDGVPVSNIEEIPRDILIVVGVTELVQKDVLPMLEGKGFIKVFPLTQHEEHLLMSAYYESIGLFTIADMSDSPAGINIDTDKTFILYEISNDKDKILSSAPLLRSFERRIQAGAAISKKRICELADDTGENISDRNRQYCEMTAAYWIWKNRQHDWVGIEHYRRHLLVEPEMLDDDVDVILPLPYICYPNEAAQFRRFVSESVLNALLRALKDFHPDEYSKYYSIILGKYQYTYNLLCARWNVFDDYCSWFFEITEYMEGMADEVPEIRDTRALSYVAEVLTNIYFMSKQDSLRIKHAEKMIYI